MADQGLAKVSHIIYRSAKFCAPKNVLRVLERECLCLCVSVILLRVQIVVQYRLPATIAPKLAGYWTKVFDV